MKKRLFSLLLVLTLCFTLLPYSAAAEGGEETMVTVTFDMCGHGGAAPASVTVPKGSKITAPESPAPGCEDGKYYFVHWTAHPFSDASSDAWNFAKDTVESSMTLRAVWYQYADMHEKVSLRGKPYAGALVEYRDRAGSVVYTLKASGTDGNCTDYVCESTKPGEYDLYIDGKYIRPVTVNRGAAGYSTTTRLFYVTFSANGQEFTPETRPADVLCFTSGLFHDDSVSMPKLTPKAVDSAYTFSGWTVGPEADSDPFDFANKVYGDTVVYAQWEKAADEDSVLVTAIRSSIIGEKYAKKGQDYSARLVPDEGYELPYHTAMGSYTSYTYVTIGDEVLNSANYTLNCATGDITIPGKYVTGDIRIKTIPRIHPYTVTFDPNGGTGTQTPMLVFPHRDGYDYEKSSATPYAYFRAPECTFTPPDGKVFAEWSGGEKIASSLRVRGNATLTAQWADAPEGVYTVAFDLNGCTFSGKTNTQANADYSARLAPRKAMPTRSRFGIFLLAARCSAAGSIPMIPRPAF